VRLYRERYGAGGLFEARVYDGMPEALQALRLLPARLFVCTAKPHAFAVPVLAYFGLTSLFTGIYGVDLRPIRRQGPADPSHDREGEH
jgi:phosphoglycolate phosphatase